MKEYLEIQKPKLGYTYEFETDQLDLMSECLEAHGFAIIKDVLPPDLVESVKQAVFDGTDPNKEVGARGESYPTRLDRVGTRGLAAPWIRTLMKIHRYLIGANELTLHRSAAIIRMPGSQPVGMAQDWCGFSTDAPKNSGDVLNRGLWPSGKWFYLTGLVQNTAGCA